jgi:signal transduction histidine kinase
VKLSLDRGRHLPDEVERQLILITQEAIGNALKHSHTDVIVVAFRSDKRAATVRVTDRGCGFSVAARTGLSGHYGIAGMRERAGEIGASFELQSAEGAGTTVLVQWPLEQKAVQPGNIRPDAARLSKQR